MATRTPTIDSQVHAYERNRPERPWLGFLQGPDEVTGDDMVAAMDAVGVDGALLVSPFSMYGYDAGYALEVYEKHPGKFGLIKPFDPESESIDDEMAEWTSTPGWSAHASCLRTGISRRTTRVSIGYSPPAPTQVSLINVMCSGKLPLLRELASRHPDTQIVIDHVGLVQPFEPPPAPEPFADLANVISLAEFDNVAIKISGACTLSREPFPYPDIWAPLSKVFDAFGFDRCMWGTDWTRAVELLTYEQGVEAFRVTDQLSDSERSALMGGTLAKIYGWSPDVGE